MPRPQRQLRAPRLLRPHLHLPQRLETHPRRLQSLPLAQNAHREAGPTAARATCSGRRSRAAVAVVSAVAVAVVFLPSASVHVVIPTEARPILPRRRGISPRFLRLIAPNTQRNHLRFTLDNAVATTKKKSLRTRGGSPFSVPALSAKARSSSKLTSQCDQRLGCFQLLRLLQQGFLCHGGSSGLASPVSFSGLAKVICKSLANVHHHSPAALSPAESFTPPASAS
jgi:hypothetical protein